MTPIEISERLIAVELHDGEIPIRLVRYSMDTPRIPRLKIDQKPSMLLVLYSPLTHSFNFVSMF